MFPTKPKPPNPVLGTKKKHMSFPPTQWGEHFLLVPLRVAPFKPHLRRKAFQLGAVEEAIAVRVLNATGVDGTTTNQEGDFPLGMGFTGVFFSQGTFWAICFLLLFAFVFGGGEMSCFFGGEFLWYSEVHHPKYGSSLLHWNVTWTKINISIKFCYLFPLATCVAFPCHHSPQWIFKQKTRQASKRWNKSVFMAFRDKAVDPSPAAMASSSFHRKEWWIHNIYAPENSRMCPEEGTI